MNRLRRHRLSLLLALGASAIALSAAGSATSAHAPFQLPAVPPSSYVAGPPTTWIDTTGGSEPCLPDFICYRPAELRQIYDVPAGADGAGQTIIIVDAFGSRSLLSDLAQFDLESGLPNPSLTIIGPNGSGNAKDPTVQGWAVETTLDVEWAHAFAPRADIVLSISGNDNAHSLTQAVERAERKYSGGAIISQSFGGDETFVKKGFIDETGAHSVYVDAVAMGDTILAATGDFGASGTGDTGIAVWYPASDPLVTAVGGTEGNPWPDGLQNAADDYGGEQTWNETVHGIPGATGGGPSQLFPAPAYQSGVTGHAARTVPDVALNASVVAGSVIVFEGLHGIVGGTSVSTAEWAGIFALVNQARAAAGNGPIGQANPALYALAKSHPDAFHDVTTGNNTFDPAFPGFSAGPGYDLTTGLGTPDVAKIVGYLAVVPSSPLPSG